MKRWKVALVSVGLLGCFFTVVETAKAEEGTWQGKTYLKADGKPATNQWIYDQTQQAWFYLTADGNRAENGWLTVAGKDYYFNEAGKLATKTWVGQYYVTESGAKAKEQWVFNQEQESWYYLKSDGQKAQNEWIQQGQEKYYLKEDGKMAKDEWITQGENQYYINSQGKMLKNAWLGKTYLSENGHKVKQAWIYDDNYSSWFYLQQDGTYAENGWQTIDGKDYHFKFGGYLSTERWIDRFYVAKSGAKLKSEWLFDKNYNSWFYLKADGTYAEKGWQTIKGKDYHFKLGGYLSTETWIDRSYVTSSGAKAGKGWLFDKNYNSWFYINSDGNYVNKEWLWDNGYYYLKSGGYMAASEWVWYKNNWFYLKSNGKMAEKELIYDSSDQSWYYLKSGGYMAKNETVDGHTLDASGRWHVADKTKYYKVKPITAYVYSASGEILSYINQGSIVSLDSLTRKGGRLAVSISGLSGYMNQSDLTAVDEGSEFIPHYTSDGKFLYHELSPYTSIKVAPHTSAMVIGKKYYSTDGEHFDGFTIKNPFLYKNLREPSNYSAAELDKLYSMMNLQDSPLAGKGATFKEAEERYGVNALYLMAHSALESAWGRSQIARDKNNFFGIAAYDTSPYLSAKSFDNVDKGILGAAKWIRENYIDYGRDHLGNKATGMNVRYASDPYWGEKIASIMMTINSKLGWKD
ncbi:glucosaminidase domain-containing protein [Streptococcus oralis]|uniref:glucosaminidase domain-containing protein n=1 Tax=Streptococcus oralis TaxID=1303 RepID=UPI000C7BEC71|nr:glucosaminidase domain-containing protein [Streptococcus oralis]MBR8665961.1 glucosaminidase domain-containing protein [Streptococcus oralis]MDU3459366.1 glucosaminidase domain-containing protein [Streptococcus oralis]PLA08143.1 endo-beta-N-acetylglucosaminidase [Streptococcus oralis subsp. dentisani]